MNVDFPVSNMLNLSREGRKVCDDWNDNCWLESCERLARIEDDEPLRHFLAYEYPQPVAVIVAGA